MQIFPAFLLSTKASVQAVPASSLIGLILEGVGHGDLRYRWRRNSVVVITAYVQPDFFNDLANSLVLSRVTQPELLPHAPAIVETGDPVCWWGCSMRRTQYQR